MSQQCIGISADSSRSVPGCSRCCTGFFGSPVVPFFLFFLGFEVPDINRATRKGGPCYKMATGLPRFHGLIQDWQFQLKRLEDPSARNVSFPNLQTERDWAEAVRSDSIHDGESLMEHAGQLRHQIARIDEEVEVLNERLQRPQSARMVALSLLYTAPQDAVLAASGHFLRWLAGTIKRKQERPKPETEDQAALQAEVQQLQHRLDEMQGQKDEFEGTPERQLQSGPEGQQETPEVFHFEEFHSFGKDAVPLS